MVLLNSPIASRGPRTGPERAEETLSDKPISVGKLAGSILALALVGIPLVAWIWESLNELLAGHVEPGRLLLTVPALALLYALLRWMARLLGRIESKTASS